MIPMRALAALLVIAAPAAAEDVPLRAPPTEATVFLSGARVLREGTVDLPPGRHALLVPLPAGAGMPAVEIEGAALRGLARRANLGLDPEAVATPPEAAARDALDAAQRAVADAADAVELIEARIAGHVARAGVLGALDTRDRPVAETAAVAEGVAEALSAAARLRADLRAAQEAADDAEAARRRAATVLAALAPPEDGTGGLVIDVDAGPGGPVALRLTHAEPSAGWTPEYDLHLDTEAGTLRVERRAAAYQSSGEAWTDVALTLTASAPGRLDPSEPFPDIARLFDEVPTLERRAVAAPAPMVVEEALAADAFAAEIVQQGLAVSYVAPGPVTLAPDGSRSLLPLGTLDPTPRIEVRAVPEYDEVGYLVVSAANPSETLVPGPARLLRDGALVGETELPLWAEGAELDLSFGAVDTIRLAHVVEEEGRGDQGLIRRSGTRRASIRFEVENTGTRPREVVALYPLPVSEDDDLRIDVTATPSPDMRDWEDRRGVAAWEWTLAPGETRTASIEIEMTHPEDRTLVWGP